MPAPRLSFQAARAIAILVRMAVPAPLAILCGVTPLSAAEFYAGKSIDEQTLIKIEDEGDARGI